MKFAHVPTLNERVKQLLEYNLIEHHLERKELRREWYSITEKGRKIFKCSNHYKGDSHV